MLENPKSDPEPISVVGVTDSAASPEILIGSLPVSVTLSLKIVVAEPSRLINPDPSGPGEFFSIADPVILKSSVDSAGLNTAVSVNDTKVNIDPDPTSV